MLTQIILAKDHTTITIKPFRKRDRFPDNMVVSVDSKNNVYADAPGFKQQIGHIYAGYKKTFQDKYEIIFKKQ